MDHTHKYSAQDLAAPEGPTVSQFRNSSPRVQRSTSHPAKMVPAHREVEISSAATELTDEQICEQSRYWLADWNLGGMH